jgi:D-3-phosphoglycerate dehydrogenase
MHILVADDLPASALELLKQDGWTLDARSGRSPDELKQSIANADALVVRSATRVTADLIAAAPRLRAIARAGTGVDNVDVEAASARGIVVMNAPGANSISVAELTLGLMLALARKIPAADAAMKAGRWEKKPLLGEELRGKILGLVGLGRIGQEVARRAQAFDMTVLAHDPYLAADAAANLHVDLVDLDVLCARADFVTLHLPLTSETTHLFDAARLARCKKGVRIINTARGGLVDEPALAEAIVAGHVGGAGLDVFEHEPPPDHRLQKLPQVVAAPHIAASTREGQELVGVETAAGLRDFLNTGLVRNAVNFPAESPGEHLRLIPYVRLAEQLGCFVGQLGEARISGVSVEYAGELTADRHPLIVSSVLTGLFRAILSDAITPVNARAVAASRGITVTESSSSRPGPFTNLLSVTLATNEGERRVAGAVVERQPRLVLLDGVPVEAPLGGTLIVLTNRDQPGVIGDVGTVLGRRGINVAFFALGRNDSGAVGVVNVDDPGERTVVTEPVLQELRAIRAVKSARVVRT